MSKPIVVNTPRSVASLLRDKGVDAHLVLANVMAVLGSQPDWSTDTLYGIVRQLEPARVDGLASYTDQSNEDLQFWCDVAGVDNPYAAGN